MAIRLTVRPPGSEDSTELTFDQQRVRIGRGAMCDLRIPHNAVSAVHAMIIFEKDRYFLVDPGSTNGTTLDGEMLVVERRKLLRSGDTIGIAGFEIVFSAGVAMAAQHSQNRTAVVARQLAQHVMAEGGDALRAPSLVVVSGPQQGRRFEMPLPPATITIGRAEDNNVVLDDREASRRHVEVEISAEGVMVRDLGGKNILMVNDREVERSRLKDRDELLIGATRLVFDEPVEAYLREISQWPDDTFETDAKPVGPGPAESMSEGSSLEVGSSKGSEPTPVPQQPVTPSLEMSSVEPSRDSASSVDAAIEQRAEEPSEPPSEEIVAEVDDGASSLVEGSEVSSGPKEPQRAPKRGSSAGVEIAILLVGGLALVICVAALVWIFR